MEGGLIPTGFTFTRSRVRMDRGYEQSQSLQTLGARTTGGASSKPSATDGTSSQATTVLSTEEQRKGVEMEASSGLEKPSARVLLLHTIA